MKLNDLPAIQPAKKPYGLTEGQYHSIYQARHLCSVLSAVVGDGKDFISCRTESMAVVFGLISDLLDNSLNDHDNRSNSHA